MRSDVVNAVLEKRLRSDKSSPTAPYSLLRVHPYPLGPLSLPRVNITDSRISASDQMQLEHAGLLVNVIGSSV